MDKKAIITACVVTILLLLFVFWITPIHGRVNDLFA